MPRIRPKETATGEHDSFLDIVANIVGILIILVMVVGVRAKNAPPPAAIADPEFQEKQAELKRQLAIEQSLRRDVWKLAEQAQSIVAEAERRYIERAQMAAMVSAWQHKLETTRQKLDAQSTEHAQLRRALADAEAELARLQRQRQRVARSEPERKVIESYPTPISHTVDGNEVHFQLRHGRIAAIPLERLIERLQSDAQSKAYKLMDLPEITETVGPVAGFRMRYTIRRFNLTPQMQMQTGRTGSVARLTRWVLLPVSGDLGETVEEALQPGSEFLRTLSQHDPSRITVTVWTYPESFSAFRQIKKRLYEMGFACAARPLPEGLPISGSPQGTKSAAQ